MHMEVVSLKNGKDGGPQASVEAVEKIVTGAC